MLDKISQLVDKHKITTFDALMMIIEEEDLEPAEVIKDLPQSIVEQLRQDAINDNKLRPSTIAVMQQTFSVNDFFQ